MRAPPALRPLSLGPVLAVVLGAGCRPSVGPIDPPRPTVAAAAPRTRLYRPHPSQPFFAVRGGHWLRARFDPSLAKQAGRYLATLEIDGATVFPPQCPLGPLCTPEHAAMVEDHGSQALLVAVRETEERVDVVVAGAFYGSPECGVYGYYVVRIEGDGARVGPPARGCFSGPEDGHGIEPGPPLRLVPSTGYGHAELELDEGSLGWTVETRTPLWDEAP